MDVYKVLTPIEAVRYIRETMDIFSDEDELVAKQLPGTSQSVDGHVNVIITIRSVKNNKSVILKQMMPYLKSSTGDRVYKFIPLGRIKAEVDSIKLWDTICPNSVPKIYLWDDVNKILVMEDLSRLSIMSSELFKRKKFPQLPKQLGTFLGKTAFYTSDLFLTYNEKNNLKNMFTSCSTKYLWEDLMFNGPILDNSNYHINVKVKKELDILCNNRQVRQEVVHLREIYVNKKQCLIHSDLHTSNIFVDNNEMRVFDTEFATYGPISFDIGRLLSSLVLSYASLLGRDDISETEKIDYQEYLLEMIEAIYREFNDAFHMAWERHLNKRNDYQTYYNQFYRKSILKETLGFMACASIIRIYDEGLCFDFERIDDLEKRGIGQRFIIKLAEKLLLYNKKINKIEELKGIIKAL